MLLLPALAAAESASEPPPPSTRGFSVRTGFAMWQPRADARSVAETSPGLRPEVAYTVLPGLAVTAAFDWVIVDKADGVGGGDAYFYAASLGARYTVPVPGRVRPVVAASLGRYSLHVDCASECGGALVHDNALGGRIEGGLAIAINPWLNAQATLGYSHARMDMGVFTTVERDLDALVFDTGLGIRL
jgi:Outer membrane protein beta-barrel domain